MLAMLLSPAERRRPDKALEEMRKSGVVVDGMVFARFVALLCSVSIVWFVLDTEFFLNTLGWGGTGCSGMDTALGFYAVIAAGLSISLHFLVRWVSLCATTSKCKAALLAWSDGIGNGAAICLKESVIWAAYGIALEYWSLSARFILLYGGIAVVGGCISAALQAKADRLNKNERSIAAGL